ncbi:MAG: hypothetical protein J1F63_06195 [Oscillospiraceae bacterium]|nr:hypothetical protein [Oscillospiraceae bacterium]
MSKFQKYWLGALLGTLAAAAYPIYMGVSVVYDMATKGTVLKESYPKYIIPYAPIALSVIIAVILMPLIFRYVKKYAIGAASVLSSAAFFVSELLLESRVIVTETLSEEVFTGYKLESWQMYMCYVSPAAYETRTWTEVNVLMGEYSPAFKLHFYMISIILIISLINCLYGFGAVLCSGNRSRVKALVVQSVCTAIFLGLCIFACFTAFFRTGEITVSPMSAALMILFFIVLGVTAGIFAGSFLMGRETRLSVMVPCAVSTVITLVMYIGEMILLSGHLYRFGAGALFDGLPGIVLAPVDILTVLLSGFISAGICHLLNRR